jgi:protein-L-isoaspartate O-methyltransferase
MLSQVENRRTTGREKSFQRTTYVDSYGVIHRTQVINSSDLGARLTTRLGIRVGDQLFIRQALTNGTIIEVAVEVKWVKPAGLCQVVGVKTLERLPQLVSQAA